ncbi:hypothetical protein RJT34_02610 [Clitoria ternatea]|uniref:Uncharacterized protein n=1 Tax=Clitoria ternatea TaxID=43366 RepID=A0AAN9KHY9_CLITE
MAMKIYSNPLHVEATYAEPVIEESINMVKDELEDVKETFEAILEEFEKNKKDIFLKVDETLNVFLKKEKDIRKTITDRHLKFEEQPKMAMKIDSDPLHLEAIYAEPVNEESINMVKAKLEDVEETFKTILEEFEKNEKDIFLKAYETLDEFLRKKKDVD